MSRRRYISTDLSTDIKLAELADHGTLPLLLFTWAIPHMDDWGRMAGDSRQFKLLVCPALDITNKEVEAAILQIASVGLWDLYEVDNRKYIAIPEISWFKHQSYINKSKRDDDSGSNFPKRQSITEEQRRTPKNTEEEHYSADNAVSFSPSPSFSPTPSPTVSSDICAPIVTPQRPTKRFIHPTFDEVNEYCLERNNGVDAQKWFDYYSSNGWKVGKNAMKDWKAAVRTWERNDGGGSSTIGRTGKAAYQPSSVRVQDKLNQMLRDAEARERGNQHGVNQVDDDMFR